MRNFEITKREVLVSISIIAVMILVGILISAKITERQMDRNEVYNKAVKIDSQETFSYGMRTNVGNAFVYGTLEALDPVSYPEIDGSYMYVEKIKKLYTMHTRTVAHTDANGNTTYTIETYWSWDYAGEESKAASTVSFCEATFPISKFELPGTRYIDTIYESGHVRYEYYGIGITHTGTIFTTLSDNTISDSSPFYEDLTIDEAVNRLEKGVGTTVFWIFWIIGTGVIVFKFYERENEWLE
jgi:hypothetical protein